MPSPTTCTAYRWPKDGGVAVLLVLPSGQSMAAWAGTELGAVKLQRDLAKTFNCSVTQLYFREPSFAPSEVAHA